MFNLLSDGYTMISAELDELKSKFISAYANLPEPERVQVMAVVNDKPYSWDAAYNEINADTELGYKILRKLKVVGIV